MQGGGALVEHPSADGLRAERHRTRSNENEDEDCLLAWSTTSPYTQKRLWFSVKVSIQNGNYSSAPFFHSADPMITTATP